MERIAFFMPKLDIGGIESVFITYANALIDKGFQVDFILCITGGKLQSLLSPSINIVDLGGIKLRRAFLPLRRYLKAKQPDYIYTGANLQNLVVTACSVGLKTKVIISQHNYFDVDEKRRKFIALFMKTAMKVLYPLSDLVVCVSKGIQKYVIEEVGIDKKKAIYLPNPIDSESIYKRAKEPTEEVLPNDYIVFIGRLSKVKNLPLILRAFNLVKNNVHLLIIGDGIEMENVKNIAAKSEKSAYIHFLGSKTNPLPYLAQAKCLLLCSLSEALPTILLESMALEVPIVATPTKGACEILENVPNTFVGMSFIDANEYAELIEKACSAENANMKGKLENYKMDTVISSFINYIQSI